MRKEEIFSPQGVRKEDVTDEGAVDGGAGRIRKRNEGEIRSRKVAIPPEVDGRSIAVVSDELNPSKVDRRECVVLKAGPDVREREARRATLKAQRSLRGGRMEKRSRRQTREP